VTDDNPPPVAAQPVVQLQFVLEGSSWWRPRTWGSAAIAWFSAGHLSHVDSIVPPGIDWAPAGHLFGARSDAVGGQPPGVRVRPPDYALFKHRVVATIPASDEEVAAFWQFQRAQLGKPYDSRAIWGFVFGRNWREIDSWICSEDASAAVEAMRRTVKFYVACNKITPVACALAVSAMPGTTMEVIA